MSGRFHWKLGESGSGPLATQQFWFENDDDTILTLMVDSRPRTRPACRPTRARRTISPASITSFPVTIGYCAATARIGAVSRRPIGGRSRTTPRHSVARATGSPRSLPPMARSIRPTPARKRMSGPSRRLRSRRPRKSPRKSGSSSISPRLKPRARTVRGSTAA